jgi:hypothetical protein
MSFTSRFAWSIATVVLSAGCASRTPGTNPHDMSARQHEATADAEGASAEVHGAVLTPSAARSDCPELRGASPCWSSDIRTTRATLATAEAHRARAAEHRAASQALRVAEETACGGISNGDRDMSPFARREDIVRVEPLVTGGVESAPSAGPNTGVESRNEGRQSVDGAVVTFRAVPGMTAQWFQRLVDCHLARNAALGHDVPEMAYCPLVPKGASARVTATAAGFAVAIRAGDPATANEILTRARALVAR